MNFNDTRRYLDGRAFDNLEQAVKRIVHMFKALSDTDVIVTEFLGNYQVEDINSNNYFVLSFDLKNNYIVASC